MGSYGYDTAFTEDFVVFGHWIPRVGKVDELLECVKPILEYASHNTGSIICFYLLQEKKDDRIVAVTTAGCFKTQQAYEQYLRSTARLLLDKACKKLDLLSQPQREQRLKTVAGFPFRPASVPSIPAGHTAMAKIHYVPEMRSRGIEHWKAVARAVEETEEEGTHTYWFLTDPEDENALYTLERYKDAEYLWDTHVPGEAIQQNIHKQKDIRTGLEHRFFVDVV